MRIELEAILNELKKFFGKTAKEVGIELQIWGQYLLLLREALAAAGTKEEKERILRTEKYAWRGIETLKNKYEQNLEEISWKVFEKLLKILRNVLLAGLI